ncbi:MAG: AtpZ/AtpI family protein [Pseudomonadota bacterium]|jgi:ATP synthase protein I|nr:AtpZ/AtpI family protein [Pseudomonadota bacterium]
MAENEPGQDPKLTEDARLQSLEKRLRQAQADEAVRTGQARAPADRNQQLGNRVLSYLIGGLAGGALIGWVLDRLLGTSPWLLISLLVLGTIGGFWNIIKLSTQRPD